MCVRLDEGDQVQKKADLEFVCPPLNHMSEIAEPSHGLQSYQVGICLICTFFFNYIIVPRNYIGSFIQSVYMISRTQLLIDI